MPPDRGFSLPRDPGAPSRSGLYHTYVSCNMSGMVDSLHGRAIAAAEAEQVEATVERAKESAADTERRVTAARDSLRHIDPGPWRILVPGELEVVAECDEDPAFDPLVMVGRFTRPFDGVWDAPRWHPLVTCDKCGEQAATVDYAYSLQSLGRLLLEPGELQEHDGCRTSVDGSWDVVECRTVEKLAQTLNEWDRTHSSPRIIQSHGGAWVIAQRFDPRAGEPF